MHGIQYKYRVTVVLEQQVLVMPSTNLMACGARLFQFSFMDILVTTLTVLQLSLITIGPGIGITVVVILIGRMTLLTSHGYVRIREGKARGFMRLGIYTPQAIRPFGVATQMATFTLCDPGRSMRIRMAFLARFTVDLMVRQRAGRSLLRNRFHSLNGRDRVAIATINVCMDAFELENIVVSKSRGRIEGVLVVTIQARLLRRPRMNIHMTRQAILF